MNQRQHCAGGGVGRAKCPKAFDQDCRYISCQEIMTEDVHVPVEATLILPHAE